MKIWANNNKYDGMWSKDQREGKGTMTFTDSKYVGLWKDDLMSGKGNIFIYLYNYE